MEVARFRRIKGPLLNLDGGTCKYGHKVFPARDVCPICARGEDTIFKGRRIVLAEETNNTAVLVLLPKQRVLIDNR